ncbi:MAG: ATP-dependent helicase Lhr and Lhr-like helicase [Thermoanaerobacterium sp.]|jgi:ATP-dependent Lhr-like helicase|nr:ATP-dependent helicase Lhr and Lhr-like helicase [Thermoanaerobacterium sp.]MDK2811793.1 ATP-dependent helicase Lhr and Lhr-like helicase [Petrotoga sp.]
MTNKVIDEVKKIRDSLKHAWVPFFTKFGRLTPVQIKTIPEVLNKKNVVVASPTATGKTEAVIAPIAERFITERWEELAVLYIVPTRALANDTLARIEDPLSDMGIKTALKHGDKPNFSTQNLPNFLITTPESLDSLICRHPNIFFSLQVIILDEIHLLDNTYRGDQLRVLLYRLQEITNNKNFSVHLLSATLSNPSEIAQRYVNDFKVIKVGGARNINHYILKSLKEVYDLAIEKKWKKVLCFCNMRESVEEVAKELSDMWHPYPVVAHHGSLSRQNREEAEKIMKENNVAVCVATSTLEVGIDIGTIDLIVLAEPPWSISSLLQRIGRGNRRGNSINVVMVVRSDEEKFLMEAMLEVAISGELLIEYYKPDKSVAVQQIFSYLYQHPEGVTESSLLHMLSALCSEFEIKSILAHLRIKGWITYQSLKWYPSEKLMDLGEKGHIHSNIPDETIYRVVDIGSSKEIGTIAGVFDEVFVLAGRIWQVVSTKGSIIKVRRFNGKASSALFKRHRNVGAFYHLLPPEIRNSEEIEIYKNK